MQCSLESRLEVSLVRFKILVTRLYRFKIHVRALPFVKIASEGVVSPVYST